MKTTLEAGKYWIGDACYVISDDGWVSVCNQLAALDWQDKDGVWIEADGKQFILIGTAYGDGCYDLIKSGVAIEGLGVDSGSLAIIPMSSDAELGKSNGGFVVKIEEDFHFNAQDGDFKFGDYSVNTSDSDDGDDWGDDWREDEDDEF